MNQQKTSIFLGFVHYNNSIRSHFASVHIMKNTSGTNQTSTGTSFDLFELFLFIYICNCISLHLKCSFNLIQREKMSSTKLYRSHCKFAMIIKLKSHRLHYTYVLYFLNASTQKHEKNSKRKCVIKIVSVCEYEMNEQHFTGCTMAINRSNQM